MVVGVRAKTITTLAQIQIQIEIKLRALVELVYVE